MSIVTSGTVAFCNLKEHEEFKGKTTGRYSLVITLDPAEASVLTDKGVKVKDYEGTPQRKFSSKYDVPVLDLDGHNVDKHIPYGSKVRVLWKDGPAHPEHGTPTYLNAVRLVEKAEGGVEGNEDF